MKITGQGTIYKNQYGFSISDHQKQQDGTVNKFYVPVRFKSGLAEPKDRDYISIEGFTKPFKTKEGKLSINYFVMDWTLINSKKEDAETLQTNAEEKTDPFAEFGQEVIINDEDLPF